MVTLTPRERRLAKHRIADSLRDKIQQAENGLLPGVLLPPESQLAEQYEVSRPTIREALAILRDEGLIVTTAGQGSKVAHRPAPAADVTEQIPAPDEVAWLLQIRRGQPVIQRRQLFRRDGRPEQLVLTYRPIEVG